jgi:hypothetical protein
MMKKIVNRVLWISSLLIVLVLLIWTNIEQANSHCSDIKVQMTSGGEASLVSPDAIRSDILENMPALIGQSFKNVALEDLEKHVSANTQLSEVKTYLNLNGLINIKVSPRKAILRLSIYEIVFSKLDKAIVINEAIELAKKLASDNAPKFINGLLDSL